MGGRDQSQVKIKFKKFEKVKSVPNNIPKSHNDDNNQTQKEESHTIVQASVIVVRGIGSNLTRLIAAQLFEPPKNARWRARSKVSFSKQSFPWTPR